MRSRLLPLLALLLGCPPSAPPPATPGSPSAQLTARTAGVAERARDIAARSAALEGEFDRVRALPDAERAAQIEALRAEARALRELSDELAAEVQAIEASAQVW